jgi:hypothetical protein
MKSLRVYDVNETIFENILEIFKSYIEATDKIGLYWSGYDQKNIIYYNNKDLLIMRETLLAKIANFSEEDKEACERWRQVIVRKVPNDITYKVDIDGNRAWNYMMKLLKNYYTEEEIDAQLNSFTANYDENKIQFHFTLPSFGRIKKFDNCVKYDINGAHHDALIEIFPRAKEALTELFVKRKEKPVYKAYVNYFVGNLVNHGYRFTYNWIVQRTTDTLLKAINYVGGKLIYANTDGFLSYQPENKIEHSTELGKFKLEYEGTAYVYQDKNYWCYQTDEICGNIRYAVRDKIDLSKNLVVHYNTLRTTDEAGVYTEKVVNIEQEIIYEEDI